MALTKRELLTGGVAHQQALVKKLQDDKQVPPRKNIIPGGKTLLETVDQDYMHKAIYNWLRGCTAFHAVTISFAKEPEKYRCSKTRVRDYTPINGRPVWETHQEGRMYLAKNMASVLKEHRVVKLEATSDGLYMYQDVNNTFGPVAEVTEADVAAQEALVQEVEAEMIENGEDPTTLVYHKLEVGQMVPSEDWEPYIEFLPKKKQEYGR